MKKIFNYMFAVLAGVAALTACTNEPEEGVTPAPEGKTLTVVASMDDATKAIFTDGEGLNWSVGDVLVAVNSTAPNDPIAANALTDENIVNNEAAFTFGTVPTGNVYFSLNANTGTYTKHEYMFKNEITQDAAGGINPSFIKLLGEKVALDGTEESVNVKMKLVGTMMRYLIYSSKGTYANEQVTSVKLIGNENFSGPNAVVGINHTSDQYLQENNESSLGDNAVIFWGCDSNFINVKLNTPATLDATNAEGCIGKGVYMPVPAISLTGYKYEVTTTNYRFTFDASSKAVTFKDNEVKNVLLDVDNENVTVEELANVTKAITRDATSVTNPTFDGAAHENEKIGTYINYNFYICWAIDGVKKEGNWDTDEEIQTLYKSIKFLCHDGLSATATEATWLSIYYPTNENGNICEAHPYFTIEANTTGVERKSLVQVLISTPAGYTWNGETGENIITGLQFEITQEAASVEVVATLDKSYDGTAVSKNGADVTVGTLTITADGADALADYDTYCDVKISGGASVAVDTTTGVITANIPANTTSNTKEYTITIKDAKGNDLVEAVTIAQEAGDGSGDSAFSEYSWEVSLVGGRAWGSAWGFGGGDANKQTGHYLSVSNITHNGTAVNFTNTAEDLELAQSIAEYAFRTSAPTDEEKAANGQSAKTGSQFAIKAFYCYGQMIQVAWVLTDNQTISKTTGYDAAGNEVGSVIVWVE